MEEYIYINGYVRIKDESKECLIITSKNTGIIKEIIFNKTDIVNALKCKDSNNSPIFSFPRNYIIEPGDFNAHSHPEQSLYTNITDKSWDLSTWCKNTIYKYSPTLKSEDIYTGCERAFTNMLSLGVTSVMVSFYCHGNKKNIFDKEVVQAAIDTGIRLYFGRMNYDIINENAYEGKKLSQQSYYESADEAAENFVNLYNSVDCPTVEIAPSVHSIHASSKAAIINAINLGNKYNKYVQFHLSEDKGDVELSQKLYGMRPIEFLVSLLTNGDVKKLNNVFLSDCVWIDENERNLIKEYGMNVVLNPRMNARIKTGTADLGKLIDAGITPYLGTDGEASNDDLSISGERTFLKNTQKQISPCVIDKLGKQPFKFKDGYISGEITPGSFCDIKVLDDNVLKNLFVGGRKIF